MNGHLLLLANIFLLFRFAFGLKITSPTTGSVVRVPSTGNFTVTWTSVSTDPKFIDISLISATQDGDIHTLCANATTSSHHCTAPATSLKLETGNETEIVVNSVGTHQKPSNDFVAKTGAFSVMVIGGSASGTSSSASSAASATSSPGAASTLVPQRSWLGLIAGVLGLLL